MMRAAQVRIIGALMGVLMGGTRVSAQTKQFSTDQAQFLAEVTTVLVEADKKEGRSFIEKTFAPAWTGPYFNEKQRVQAVEIANFMMKKRFEAFPHLRDYLGSLAAFANSGRGAAEFDAWMSSLDQLVEKGRKQSFASFIEASTGLFTDNTFYSSASTVWRCSSKQFTFGFDSIPKVIFPKTDLKCLAKGDSAVIHNTSGVYYPTLELWRGKGGHVTWQRAGLKPEATFADWDHGYDVKMKSASFEVDTVRFTDPYFDRTLIGKITDKVLANVQTEKATYPKFEGYDRRQKIKNIVEGVDFEGGFTMQGARLQGYGTKDEPAFLTFHRDKRPFIITRGLLYTIEPERITSDDVGVKILVDQDSITHVSVSLRFLRDKRQLSLIKKDEGLSKAPFYDSYHKLDMYCEVITWRQGDPVLQFGSLQGSAQQRASFESYNYFKRGRYDAMLGIDPVHPLVRIRDFVKQHGGEEFLAQDFAVFTKLQMPQVVRMLIDLANKGYLDYDPETGVVEVLPRLKEHVLASAGKVDYDVVQFNSNSDDAVNATLNLLNHDLALKGVAHIVLSDSQDVKIFPKDRVVTVKKDRDFTFGGMVQAGKLSFYGQDYYFHYAPFIIDLLNVDSVGFMADSFEPNANGQTYLVRVKNVLEQVSGTLELDAPDNKSGIQQVMRDGKMQAKYPQFPIFNSDKESYVFYDKHTIQRGAYLRDRFYFRSDPFQIDSLDNFTNKGLNFTGTLISAGIFPDMRERLGLQPDYALGFVHPVKEGTLPLYGKTAKFGAEVTLNNKGLQGNGELAYLTTRARSKQFIFCPDSTIGRADTLINTASTSPSKVPSVHASQVFVRLDPVNEALVSEKIRKPLVMYDGQAELHGRTELTPKGMTGAGLSDFSNATLASKLFQFETMVMHSDTGDFRLTEGDTASVAFRTDNVNATIKFDERIGEFVSNGSETKVEFPVNQYICFMDRFKWFMDAGDIALESDRKAGEGSEDLQLAGPNFISVRPDQDSLSFMAPRARYDLKKHLITADDVQAIQVADALVTPDSMRVRIRAKAVMDPLNNAVITANNVTRYHSIYGASVNIKSRRDYSATGDIDYVDENKKAQRIHLESINVDSTFQTYAFGRILETDGFQLSPFFDFRGQVKVEANQKAYTFTGATRIQHGCDGLARNWMGFTAPIDPLEIYIPVADTMYDEVGERIGAGLFLTVDDPFAVYGTFLSHKEDPADKRVITAKGLLTYDKAKKEYVISNKDKIRQRNLPGDLVSLNVETCRLNGDGRIRHALDLGRVKADAYGTIEHRPGEKEYPKASVVLMADFFFLDNALERMASQILTYPDQKQVDITKTNYERSLREVLGLERSDKMISELSIKGEVRRLPDELIKAISLCDVQLHWDKADEAWVSEGNIGIGSILKKPIFRYVKGKVEMERKRSGDSMTIFLKLDDENWYFFQYSRNYLYAYSSDQEFNKMLTDLKEDKTRLENKKDEAPYQYILGSKKKVNDFRDKYGL